MNMAAREFIRSNVIATMDFEIDLKVMAEKETHTFLQHDPSEWNPLPPTVAPRFELLW